MIPFGTPCQYSADNPHRGKGAAYLDVIFLTFLVLKRMCINLIRIKSENRYRCEIQGWSMVDYFLSKNEWKTKYFAVKM